MNNDDLLPPQRHTQIPVTDKRFKSSLENWINMFLTAANNSQTNLTPNYDDGFAMQILNPNPNLKTRKTTQVKKHLAYAIDYAKRTNKTHLYLGYNPDWITDDELMDIATDIYNKQEDETEFDLFITNTLYVMHTIDQWWEDTPKQIPKLNLLVLQYNDSQPKQFIGKQR